ncbi:uncharacterized protein [Apostichopus japonicus]|uniref:uncharacterized protein isoform X3 n=1 Tax=Stichopus japonicus TaxID=307972 RepID=UPI003AB76EA2
MNKLFADGVMVVTSQKQAMAAGSELEDRGGEIQIDPKKDHQNAQTLSYFGLPYQDHNYGAPPPPTPPQSPPHCPVVEPEVEVETGKPQEEPKKEVETSEEEREEEEDDDEGDDSTKDEGITRCICDFEHDDGYMICCDKCLVWQHVECMGLDRSNIPDNYFCEKCEPRAVNVENAKSLQGKKKKHLEELQNREPTTDKLGKGQDSPGSLKLKKKVKKKKKKKEKEKDRDKDDDSKTDRKKEKKKKKKDRERIDSNSIDNQSDDNLRTEGVSNEKEEELREASLIQCTPEVEKMMEEYRKNPEMFLAGAATYHGSTEDMKRTKVCIGQVSKGEVNGVVTLEQIPANQPIMQLSGTLSLKDNKRKNHSKQLESFMFVYSSFCNTEMILNAGSHDNIARFTRKSCCPNAEIRHMIFDGEIHLYLFALKDIGSNSEVTLGLDFDVNVGPHPVKCACGKKSCPVKKFWHKQKTNGIKNTNSNGNIEAKLGSPTKKVMSPLKLTLNKQVSQESLTQEEELAISKQAEIRSKSEPVTPRGKGDETEHAIGSKPVHKMTREERKMDAIMKAFERLEKSQQRRQQTLERLAQTKDGKERRTSGDSEKDQQTVKEGEEMEVESTAEKSEDNDKPIEEEEKEDEMNEVNVTEQEEIQELIPQVDNKPKPRPPRKKKKGASRKRSRNSSGASSVSIEVSSADDESNNATSSSSQSPCPAAISVSSSTLLSVQTNFNQKEASKEAVSLASPAANSKHFKFPKTKRFFMNEWLNEKAQEASADSPLTVKTENFEPVAPTLNSPNAASVRDRTCSLDVSFGSAKKRWLRQAMQETSHTGGSSGSNSPVCNGGGGASPVTPSPAVSPNSNSMDFMTPLKKRMLRHSLAEERPSQYLLPKPEGTSLFDSSVNLTQPVAMEQPLLEVKEEEEERGDDINEEEVRKNSSIDSGLSVTTPADFERAPSFPALSDHSNKELTAVRKLDLDNKDDNTEVVVQEEEKIETPVEKQVPKEPELPKESSSIPEDKKDESPVKEEVDIVKPKQEEPIIVIPAPLAPPVVPVAPPVVPVAPPVVPLAPIIANHALKRCLSDEVSFSNGEINPAYFSPKKRHLYLRQNTDPGSSERSLGGTWPRQDLSQRSSVLGKVNEENSETLSQSWSGPSEKMTSDQEKTSAQVPGQPAVVDVSSDHHVTTSDPHLAPVTSQPPGPLLVPVHGHPHPTSPVPGTSPSDPRARIVPPVAPISHVADQRLVYVDPRSQLQDVRPPSDGVIAPSVPYPAKLLPLEDPAAPPPPDLAEDPKYLIANTVGSVSAPCTPSKKKVSLLEYRKRKGSSTTKRPPENAVVEEEPNEQLPPGKPEGSVSPTSSTESSPDKPSKPANIITFKDVHVTNSGVTPEGLQSLPLFSQAPIAETSEGKKLSLTDEAHKLITSLTQVLMEGKGVKDQQNSKVTEPTSGNEDPLQRMRRELNEKNTEKVLALKRAHSPEPPPPPPEKKSRLEAGSPPVPPPPPPRNIPTFGPGIHSPKAGGLQRQANHVVVAPPPGVLGVQQVAPQTNGGHVVYSQVIPGNTPPVAQYQQPIAKHQAHSPRGQNHYSPIAASTSPRGPLVGTLPTPHPNNFQFQHKNHVEESLLPPPPVPNQIGQFYNGDRGGFHVNGDHHVNRVTPAAAAATVAVVTETARPSSQFPSNKFSPVHDKRSSSYSRSSRALSPRRGYHRH